MRPRSAVYNRLEYWLALAVLKSLEWAPQPLGWLLARGYARLLDLALPRLRRVAMRNLALAMPELGAAEHEQIVRGVFRTIARLLLVFAKLPRINRDNLGQWIRFQDFENFLEGRRRGRGVLLATSHLGNWELSAFAHALYDAPIHVLVRPLDNPHIDRLVERRRALSGNVVVEKKGSARAILQALSANQAVGILADQNAVPEEGVFVHFFGIPACAQAGVAKIAAHSGAAVVPGQAVWSEEEGRFVLRYWPPMELTGRVEEDTQRIQSHLERVIRQYPDQWLWIHRRWKTRLPGEPSLY